MGGRHLRFGWLLRLLGSDRASAAIGTAYTTSATSCMDVMIRIDEYDLMWNLSPVDVDRWIQVGERSHDPSIMRHRTLSTTDRRRYDEWHVESIGDVWRDGCLHTLEWKDGQSLRRTEEEM